MPPRRRIINCSTHSSNVFFLTKPPTVALFMSLTPKEIKTETRHRIGRFSPLGNPHSDINMSGRAVGALVTRCQRGARHNNGGGGDGGFASKWFCHPGECRNDFAEPFYCDHPTATSIVPSRIVTLDHTTAGMDIQTHISYTTEPCQCLPDGVVDGGQFSYNIHKSGGWEEHNNILEDWQEEECNCNCQPRTGDTDRPPQRVGEILF